MAHDQMIREENAVTEVIVIILTGTSSLLESQLASWKLVLDKYKHMSCDTSVMTDRFRTTAGVMLTKKQKNKNNTTQRAQKKI